jgi:uncharacterized protein (DUF2384 family)
MSLLRAPAVTSPDELAEQLEHPTEEAVWKRAMEVFGDETKARSWMGSQRPIFDGNSPEQLMLLNGPGGARRVLETLIRIEYGVYS